MKQAFLFYILIVVIAHLSGCQSDSETIPPATSQSSGAMPVLAQIGSTSIDQQAFQQYLEYRPLPSQSVTKEKLEQRLDEMVLAEILYQEALRLKLDEEPSIRRVVQQVLNQKLLERQVEKATQDNPITEEVLKQYYEQHRKQFERSRQVRVADIFMNTSSQQKAKAVLSKALNVKGKRAGFGALVQQYSEAPSTHRKGDTGYFDDEGAPHALPSELVQAAFTLKKVGDIYPKLIQTDEGFHVIMLIGQRPPLSRPFEAVKHAIKQQLIKEKRKAAHEQYLSQLRDQAQTTINSQQLASFLKTHPKPITKAPSPQLPPGLPASSK